MRISELVCDMEFYPRVKTAWLTAFQYSQAMRAGSVFPPVAVGLFKGTMFLVDGWHRLEARKLLGEEYVEAVVKSYASKREMFADAVRLNSAHGRRLSVQELVRITYKLEQWKFAPEQIAEITKIPADKLEAFQARVIVGPGGEPVYLKAISAKADAGSGVNQDVFSASSVASLLEQLALALEEGMVRLGTDAERELAAKVYGLLGEALAVGVKA